MRIFLDRPVSNSGRLAHELRVQMGERGLAWEVDVVANADEAISSELERCEGGVALTADGGLLDEVPAWFDIAGFAVRHEVPGAWVVDLGGAMERRRKATS